MTFRQFVIEFAAYGEHVHRLLNNHVALSDCIADISHHHRLPGSVIASIAGAVAVFLLIVGVLIAFFLDRSVQP